jgi:hypothetical protein
MSKLTRRISRVLLGKKETRVSGDTRKILRDAVNEAIYNSDERPEQPKSTPSNITVDETDDSMHVNFHLEKKKKPSRRFYTDDGKLILE